MLLDSFRKRRKRMSSALALAFVLTATLTCFLQADLLAACSVTIASSHDCCRSDPSRAEQQLGTLTQLVLAKPTPTVAVLPALDVLANAESAVPAALEDGSPPTARGVPAHLVLSTIRV